MILQLLVRGIPGVGDLFLDDLSRANVFLLGNAAARSHVLATLRYFFRFVLNRSPAQIAPSSVFESSFGASDLASPVEIGLAFRLPPVSSKRVSEALCGESLVLADESPAGPDGSEISVMLGVEPRPAGHLCYVSEIGYGRLGQWRGSGMADAERILSLDAITAERFACEVSADGQRNAAGGPSRDLPRVERLQLQRRLSAVFGAISRLSPLDVPDIRSPIGRTDAEYLLELMSQASTQEQYAAVKAWMARLFGAEIDVLVDDEHSCRIELGCGAAAASEPTVRQAGDGLRLMLDLMRRPDSIALMEYPETYFDPDVLLPLVDFILGVMNVRQVFVTTSATALAGACPASGWRVYLVNGGEDEGRAYLPSRPAVEQTVPTARAEYGGDGFCGAIVFVEDWRQEVGLRDVAREAAFDIAALDLEFVRLGDCISAVGRLGPEMLGLLVRMQPPCFFVADRRGRPEAEIERLRRVVPAERLLLVSDTAAIEGRRPAGSQEACKDNAAGEDTQRSADQPAAGVASASLAAYALTRYFLADHEHHSTDLVGEERICESAHEKWYAAHSVLDGVGRLLKEKARKLSGLEGVLRDLRGSGVPGFQSGRGPGSPHSALPGETSMPVRGGGEGTRAGERLPWTAEMRTEALDFLRRIGEAALSHSPRH